MKELSIEEKAKAYDKVIQEAKDLFVGRKKMYNDINTTLEHLFPELKENEDERTKNQLIDFVKSSLAGFPQCEKYIAWINKQGVPKTTKGIFEVWKDMRFEVYAQASGNRHEPNCSDNTTKLFSLNDIDELIEKLGKQKPTDKVEPKFKVGDWDADKKELKKVNSDVQTNKDEATTIITGKLLERNGFEHHEGIFSDCYDIKFNAEGYIDLIQDKKSNTEWILEILKHNDDDHSTCANRLVETISTIKELQDCLDKMNINLKIKY